MLTKVYLEFLYVYHPLFQNYWTVSAKIWNDDNRLICYTRQFLFHKKIGCLRNRAYTFACTWNSKGIWCNLLYLVADYYTSNTCFNSEIKKYFSKSRFNVKNTIMVNSCIFALKRLLVCFYFSTPMSTTMTNNRRSHSDS